MTDRSGTRGMEFLSDLHTIAESVAKDHGLSPEAATRVAANLVERLRSSWGGVQVYLAKRAPDLADRNRRIYAEFNGVNQLDLARRYNLTPQRIDDVIRMVRAERRSSETRPTRCCGSRNRV